MDIYYKSLLKLEEFCVQQGYIGWDPYDALSSPLARALSCNRKYGRIAWTQLLRRLPFNLRPLLLISKGHNPKGIGLFLGGYTKLYRAEKHSEHLGKIQYLIGLLEACKSGGYTGNCWGYNFDWQSRAFYIPKYTPTIVNSCFIGHALLDSYEYTGNQSALDMAVPIKEFLLNDLHRTRSGETFCFSYTPIDTTIVHNANLLGASLLIRLYKMTGEKILRETALESLAYTMKYQREDGSWYYAETKMQSWIDSFHTGFNLEAIRHFLRAGEAEGYKESYRRGVEFYAKNFFLEDGTPKYYHNRTYPIDIHSPAEAVVFFSGEGKKYRELTEKVLQWMLTHLQSPRGYFYFRKGAKFTNKIPYMRWGQAWAFHALTEYHMQREGGTDET